MQSMTQAQYDSLLPCVTVPKDLLEKTYENTKHNQTITGYYDRLWRETQLDKLLYKVESVCECNTVIQLDRYEKAKIKDYKRTNLCRDKFCSNCKKVIQAARMGKYIPALKRHKDQLYHLTLTQPNCNAADLTATIKKMSERFRQLIRYLRCEKKIRGLDFTEWGYEGAIRSLEVTYKSDPNHPECYHPHYHVALSLKDFDLGVRHIKNVYSYDYKSDKVTLYTENEVLIQKIWYLLMNDQTVTKAAIDKLEIGYTCKINKFEEDKYKELFKYLSKATDEDDKLLTYEHFKTQYFAFYRVKQIQGYGVFYRIDGEVSEADIEAAKKEYDLLIEYLQKNESPIEEFSLLRDLLTDFHLYTLISRKRIFKYLIDSIADG